MTDGHLTDDQLSSHLDEVSATDLAEMDASSVAAHLAGCASCRQRLAVLDAVRELIRTPVPPLPPEARSASIATVLRRAEAGRASAPAVTRERPTSIRHSRSSVLVGAAAAVLVLAAAIGVPLALSGQTTSQSRASSAAGNVVSEPVEGVHRARSSGTATGTEGLAANTTAGVSNFGKVASVDALRDRVEPALPTSSAAAPTTHATTSEAAASPGVTGTKSPGSLNPGFSVGSGRGTTSEFENCLSSAVRAANPERTIELLATVTYRGTPALVYVLRPDSGGTSTGKPPQSAMVVTARAGCKVLAVAHL